jgi:Tfp pilus assembly protein PilF
MTLVREPRSGGEPKAELRPAEVLVRAESLESGGDALGAIELLEEAVQKPPGDRKQAAALELRLGELCRKDGRLDLAVTHLERAFKLDPDLVAAIEAGRRLYEQLGDFRRVARLCEVELETTTAPARRRMVLAELARLRAERLDDTAGAAAALEDIVRLGDADAGTLDKLGQAYMTLGEHGRAAMLFFELAQRASDDTARIGYLKRALGAEPGHGEAAHALEAAYLHAGLDDELDKLYDSGAIPDAWARRAVSAARRGRLDSAKASARAAFAGGAPLSLLDDIVAAAVDGGATVAATAELYHGVADALAEAVELPPAEWAARMREAARRHGEANRTAAREAALREAIVAAPEDGPTFAALAELFGQRRDRAGLQELVGLVDAAGLDPDTSSARFATLAELFDKRIGDAGAATDAWRRADAAQPMPKAGLEIRRLQQKEERWGSVRTALDRELAAAAPGAARADVLRRLAQLSRDRADLDGADRLLGQALREKNDDAALHRARADVLDAAGRVEDLRDALRAHLSVAHERVERLNLLRKLAALCDDRLDDPETLSWACSALLELIPGDRDSLARITAAARRHQDDEALLQALDRHAASAALPAERAPLLVEAASVAERLEDLDGAAERLEKALKHDRNHVEAAVALARVQAARGHAADAALALERALAVAPTRVDLRRDLARLVDGKLKDPQRARTAWRELLDRRPADREALEALATLSADTQDPVVLEDLVSRRVAVLEGAAQVPLLHELAGLQLARGDTAAAATTFRRIVDGPEALAPADLDALSGLRQLEVAAGHFPAALKLAERQWLLDGKARLAIAVDIAGLHERAGDKKRAERAWRRVLELDATHDAALTALGVVALQRKDFAGAAALAERRIAVAPTPADRRARAVELSQLVEKQLNDPRRAFAALADAFMLDGIPERDGLLKELERLAEGHKLWPELVAVYEAEPGPDARKRRAAIVEQKLKDPGRAFQVLAGAVDDAGDALLPELERLAAAAKAWPLLVEVYVQLAAKAPPDTRVDLHRRAAQVYEQDLGDASGAFGQVLQIVALRADDKEAWRETVRLGGTAQRWEDVLAAATFRSARASSAEERLDIVVEMARVLEEKVGDRWRAFRTWQRALALAPTDRSVRDALWALASSLEGPPPSQQSNGPPPPAQPPPSPPAAKPATPSAKKPSKRAPDPTIEVSLEDVLVPERSRPDATVELSLHDLIAPAAHNKRPPTLELSLADAQPVRPPPLPPRTAPPPPPPPTAATKAPAKVSRATSAWEELAEVLLELPGEGARRLVAVAEMWECGAGQPSRALDALLAAFAAAPDDADLVDEMDRMASLCDRWAIVDAAIERAIEESPSAERAVRLLVHRAALAERRGHDADAEAGYQRALGMRPDHEEALSRVEDLYRRLARDNDLATLLERRIGGLVERLPPGPARNQRTVELAEVYERLNQTYEAITAWRRVADEQPAERRAFAQLAALHERVGQWSKVVESLLRQADLDEDAGDEAAASTARLRIGHIYAYELELAERAVDAFEAIVDEPAAELELEKLYTQLGRRADLAALYARRAARAEDPAARAELLEKQAGLYEQIGDWARAAAVLAAVARIRSDDGNIMLRLADALGKAGRSGDELEVVRRLHRRATDHAVKSQLAVRLARLYVEAGRIDEAKPLVDAALAEKPNDPAALALSERVEVGADGYAAARERTAAQAPPAEAAAAWLAAARVHLNERRDRAAARRCLESSLAADPTTRESLEMLGQLAAEDGDLDRAAELAERELADTTLPPERRGVLRTRIGRATLAKGDSDAAATLLRTALSELPGLPEAMLALAEIAARAGEWDEVQALVDEAGHSQLPATSAASFLAIADAAERGQRLEEAYVALLGADRLRPSDLPIRLRIGDNRYRAHRYREAAQILGALANHSAAAEHSGELGAALYHAALSELKLRRPDRAEALLARAVELDPGHEAALGAYADRLLERGEVTKALPLLWRQAETTPGAAARAERWIRISGIVDDTFPDAAEKRSDAYTAAVDAARAAEAQGGAPPSDDLLDRAVRAEREAGRLADAARHLADLLDRPAPPAVRAGRRREAAALDLARGANIEAEIHLRAALEIEPLDEDALGSLSGLLEADGRDDQMVQLLTRSLALLPAPTDNKRRATLFRRLGAARERLHDSHALAAYERSLALHDDRALRRLVIERSVAAPGGISDESLRAHLMALLAEEPFDLPTLRLLYGIEERRGAPDGGARVLELMEAAGERKQRSAPPVPNGILDDEDHALLAPEAALVLGPVMAALFEGVGSTRFSAPSLGERISPVGTDPLAPAVATTTRLLGATRTGAFRAVGSQNEAAVPHGHPPTAVTISASLAGRLSAEQRFYLGRALELCRPEFALANLPPTDFARLFAQTLRAFHPRHAAGADAEAQALRRDLPYKVSRKLGELFATGQDIEFSSARWRAAVQTAADRAGLIAAGDASVALRLVDGDARLALARFVLDDDYLALRARLAK